MKQQRGGYDPALFQTPLYRAWSNMKTRCHNASIPDYHRYGGRGLTVCEKWQCFAGFNEDMGPSFQPGVTLDRIDNNRGYSKQNCRWADRVCQANNRRSNRTISLRGETKTLEEWIKESGIKSSTVRQRIYVHKWSIERALGMEVSHRGH